MEMIVNNKDIALPITRLGSGQQIVFFNGGGATQISWKKVLQQLQGSYETITFDFRGHGKASASDNYSFDAFLGDAETVMDAIVSGKPIIVAWSLGADLAVAYAAKHPGTIRGIVIVDGAVPITAPLVEDEAQMRRSLKSPLVKKGACEHKSSSTQRAPDGWEPARFQAVFWLRVYSAFQQSPRPPQRQ